LIASSDPWMIISTQNMILMNRFGLEISEISEGLEIS
jgi:hypothetical protein